MAGKTGEVAMVGVGFDDSFLIFCGRIGILAGLVDFWETLASKDESVTGAGCSGTVEESQVNCDGEGDWDWAGVWVGTWVCSPMCPVEMRKLSLQFSRKIGEKENLVLLVTRMDGDSRFSDGEGLRMGSRRAREGGLCDPAGGGGGGVWRSPGGSWRRHDATGELWTEKNRATAGRAKSQWGHKD